MGGLIGGVALECWQKFACNGFCCGCDVSLSNFDSNGLLEFLGLVCFSIRTTLHSFNREIFESASSHRVHCDVGVCANLSVTTGIFFIFVFSVYTICLQLVLEFLSLRISLSLSSCVMLLSYTSPS